MIPDRVWPRSSKSPRRFLMVLEVQGSSSNPRRFLGFELSMTKSIHSLDFETSSRIRFSKCETRTARGQNWQKKLARNLSGKPTQIERFRGVKPCLRHKSIFRLVRGPLRASRPCAQATLLEPFPATANNNLWCNVGSRSLRSMRSIFQSRQRCLDALGLLTSAAIFVGI